MHVLLIQPSQFKDEVSLLYGGIGTIEQPPMGLAMLAAVLLEDGFAVEIIAVDAEHAGIDAILAAIDRHDTRLVGMSVTTPVFHNAVRLAEAIKAQRPEVKMCLGGYHASTEPLSCLEPAAIDFVVKGEGERTVVELARAVMQGGGPELMRAVNGLYYKSDGQIMANPERELIADLDSLPLPARRLFKRQDYTYPDTKFFPAFPVYTSRGCPGKCTFCQQQVITGRRLRVRSPSKVADEVEHLVSEFHAREIHIWDDMFTMNKKRVFQMRDEFRRRNINVALAFTAGIRVDTASREVLEAMKEMGGYAVAFGVESGAQEILDRAQKHIRLDQVRRAVAEAKAVGLETWCFFMLGLLGDTRDTIERTIDFAIELDPDVAKFHILKPYPGSEIHRQMKEKNLILDYDYDKYGIHTYPVHRTEELSPEDIFQYQRLAYRRFFFRPKIILRHLGRLNSWTRVKNNVGIGWGLFRLAFKRSGAGPT